MTLQTYAEFQTNQRLEVLETIEFCSNVAEGWEYRAGYRPNPELVRIADDSLHALMNYRAEHNDPLAF